ncbi:nucleoside-triphosphatase [Pneumocystis jirovecii RU7]|uniref:Adenylate kinase isoenzyme 6 homolog n=1 Tax=Pneumocystis jirovecii (strain RU7) TaxID=1408657 RepID=A0A0W4ZIP3_PNEJ7|nr:nucleoside-triphosphatase [Pneumocystis jirovecii RU7]KTW28240.1 hypothetical protein T551_02659 [Pneumocystis jirovecii RU7]
MLNVQSSTKIIDIPKKLETDFSTCNPQNSVNSISSITRCRPNILMCGTPGTGKTTHALRLCRLYDLHHLSVGDIVKKSGCHKGKDATWDAYIVDEVKLLKYLEKDIQQGGVVVDWHTCNVFPVHWVDLVVVLRTQHTLLWDRLVERKYTLRKIQENNEAEIMQIVLDEAITSFGSERVMELTSDVLEQVNDNVMKIGEWIQQWQQGDKSRKK